MTTLADRIKRARLARGLTQEELAEQVETTRSNVTLWEGGREPSPTALAAMVRKLRVDGDWLLTGDGEMERGKRGVEAKRLRAIENIASGRATDEAIRYFATLPTPGDPDVDAAASGLDD